MTIMPSAALLTLTLMLLGACDSSPAPSPASPPGNAVGSDQASTTARAATAAADPVLTVEGEGLRLWRPGGSARPLPFGLKSAALLDLLAFRGAPESGSQSECGPGPLDYAVWPDGLKLYFQQGAFAGWALDLRAAGPKGPDIATPAGIGPGATRSTLTDALNAEIAETSLGTEFTAGDMSGVLDSNGANARITDMWAGASCVMR